MTYPRVVREFPVRFDGKFGKVSSRCKVWRLHKSLLKLRWYPAGNFQRDLRCLFSFSVRSGSSCAGNSAANGWSTSNTTTGGLCLSLPSTFFGSAGKIGQTPEVRSQKLEIRSRLVAAFIGIPALFLLLPVRLFEIATPEWRPLSWIHAASVATLTLLYLWCVGGKPWVRHFAFPVAFFFVAVPWPTAVEVPIIQGLMRMVADVAAETAMLLGIPAQVEGNLIRVSTGLVGVNEACSGIRSLQTSLMIGLLFGELKRLSVLRRVALVVGAVVIAIFANFVRAVFLVTVAATKNISEVSRWHDIAGYTIIALVFLSTMGLAYWLGKSEIRNRNPNPVRDQRSSGRWSVVSSPYVAAALCWLLFVEIGIAAWYRAHETNLVSGIRWTVQWPEQAPNFRKLNIDPEIRSVLRFDEGQSAAWMLTPPPTSESSPPAKTSGTQVNRLPPNAVACYLYVFRWNPGRNSALLANLHRPDVCLPASGWTPGGRRRGAELSGDRRV